MNFKQIGNTVRSVMRRIGDVAVSVQLIRKTYGTYVAGVAPVFSETTYQARLIQTKTPTTRSGMETGPALDKSVHMGVIECDEFQPQADDDLVIAGERYTIVQAAPLDLGAGVLFEVWYR